MSEYPVPSISWKSAHGKPSSVHFEWEFGVGGTACESKIPTSANIDRTLNRQVTCKNCLSIIYNVPYYSAIADYFSNKRIINNDYLVKLINGEISNFSKYGRRFGAQARVARAIGVDQSSLSEFISGRKPVTERVARYFGYTKVIGYVRHEKRHE